jgi:hypothetical protein
MSHLVDSDSAANARRSWIVPLLLTLGIAGCVGEDEAIGEARAPIVVCEDVATEIPAEAWTCGEDIVLQCSGPWGTPAPPLYLTPELVDTQASLTCGDVDFLPSLALGSLSLGEQPLTVTQLSLHGSLDMCASTVTVVDTLPPAVTTTDRLLWPPNHALQRLTIADCAQAIDVCDPDVSVVFTRVTSDEPEEATADGNHEPDAIFIGCDQVDLRSERQGDGDGRVYRLFWRAADASGNVVEGSCSVSVTHDQSGAPAVEEAAAYDVATACAL